MLSGTRGAMKVCLVSVAASPRSERSSSERSATFMTFAPRMANKIGQGNGGTRLLQVNDSAELVSSPQQHSATYSGVCTVSDIEH